MLGLAKRVGARFLLTSTSEVYGDPLEHPQKGGQLVVEAEVLEMIWGFWRAWAVIMS